MSTPKLIYIAGPCVLESVEISLAIGRELKHFSESHPEVDFYFKASFDKANRTSLDAYRGPGLERGLAMLAEIKAELGVPVLSDVHDVSQIDAAAEVLDVIQIPAFLSRQTDLLVAAAQSGCIVNVKKAQFMSPADMEYVVNKLVGSGAKSLWLTERGSTFGYNNLVVDFRSLDIMREFGYPVIFDATHAVQIPSQGGKSSGNREYVVPLARAAAAYGIDGLFTEVYPNPDDAKCDGPNSLALATVPGLLDTIQSIRSTIL
ncbi:MAG: 3-deoxy-8-phosphooctulonate synthase [Candidatus Hydrogenedentota bacterium]